MRAIVSLGSGEDMVALTGLLRRLAFSNLEGNILRVLERMPAPSFLSHPAISEDVIERFLKMQEVEALENLSDAQSRFARSGIPLGKQLKQGMSPANVILESADEQGADLIVTGSRDAPSLSKMISGSVTRKLVSHAKQSLLVARNLVQEDGPLKVVLATDHSEYFSRCLDTLLYFAPKGIAEITVVTAFPRAYFEQVAKYQDSFHGDLAAWMETQLETQNQKVISRLAPLGCRFVSRVVGGHPDSAIESAVTDSKADLVILGSQGHGFFERLTTGSLSFDQVAQGKTSVMVLRAR
jgi:nucleotide-binding universal stress UspA family protein